MEKLPPELIENIVSFMDSDSVLDLYKAYNKNPEAQEDILNAALRNGIYMKELFSRAFRASRGATKSEGGMNLNEMLLFLKKFYNTIPENLERHFVNNAMTYALKPDAHEGCEFRLKKSSIYYKR
jgi:hypothetical protein